MSNLLYRKCALLFARQNLCHLQKLNTPKVLSCCNVRHYRDPNERYKYWSYEPPGVLKKDEGYLSYLGRNLYYKWLEAKDHFTPKIMRPEQSRVIWQYEGPESLECFAVSSDETIGGQSKAYLTISRNNKLMFYGKLSTVLPKDGTTERSGYCWVQLKERHGAFNKEVFMDLAKFNKLVLRVRGDGRAYHIRMKTKFHWAELHHDIWSYVFYTRGGPHWQDISIPFSKFFQSSKGRLFDRQQPLEMDKISWIGIMMGDKVNGEFSLEIDSIRAEYDPAHFEEFAYERYGGFKT